MPLTKCLACRKEISTEAIACPSCGHSVKRQAAPEAKKNGCLVVVLVVVTFVTFDFLADKISGRGSNAFDINKPETIASIIHEAVASPNATFRDGKLSLTYSIDPWLLTASTAKSQFFFKAKEFFSSAFNSPRVQFACVEGSATFRDIRGNESQGKAISLCMSRDSAYGVKWENIEIDQMLLLVDSSFIHPSFNK
jgi:hypothetical protein